MALFLFVIPWFAEGPALAAGEVGGVTFLRVGTRSREAVWFDKIALSGSASQRPGIGISWQGRSVLTRSRSFLRVILRPSALVILRERISRGSRTGNNHLVHARVNVVVVGWTGQLFVNLEVIFTPLNLTAITKSAKLRTMRVSLLELDAAHRLVRTWSRSINFLRIQVRLGKNLRVKPATVSFLDHRFSLIIKP